MSAGIACALSPLVRRIVAPNGGPMTGPGTNTYLVGIDEVAVIDPGPDSNSHIEAIIGASMKERIRWILLTHGHPDHAPGAVRLAKQTKAEILAFAKTNPYASPTRTIKDGTTIEGTEFGLKAIATPGHCADHLCFYLEEERFLFTGDTVLEGMTSVIAPVAGGDMAAYLLSLERLRKMRLARIAPGHGDILEEPRATLDEYISHRHKREKQILARLKKAPSKIPEIVTGIYQGYPTELMALAEMQIHAHLLKLKAEGRVTGRDTRSTWSLT